MYMAVCVHVYEIHMIICDPEDDSVSKLFAT